MMANHAPWKFVCWNEMIHIERWSFISSELKLMERWDWWKTKIRAFFKLLEADQMIIKKSDTKKTAFILLNYDKYQTQETTKKLRTDNKQTTNRQQTDTNNNENNSNNENNKETIYIPEFSKEFQELYKSWIKDRKDRKKPVTEKAQELQLKRCKKWWEQKSVSIIQKAIEKWWIGLEDYEWKDKNQWTWKHFVDYEAEKKKTLEREKKADQDKIDAQAKIDSDKRKMQNARNWFNSLPEESELKKKIQNEIDSNKTIQMWFISVEKQPEWSLMREEKLRIANLQKENIWNVIICQFFS